ncbi:MAG: hypothetical protein ABIO70_36280 [Pseudomonadota bacterium]
MSRIDPLQPPDDQQIVDELFATGGGTAGGGAGRHRQVLAMLAAALLLDLLGLVSCTVIPGALLALWARAIARRELAILEHGELPVQETLRLTRLERLATWLLMATGALLALQVYLLVTGAYRTMLLRLDVWLGS